MYYLARGAGAATGVVYRIGFTGGTPGGSATFVGTDATTQGSWHGVYGGEGAALATEVSTLPAYAQLTVTGASTWTWAGSTGDVRALQLSVGSGRFAPTCTRQR